MVEKSTKTDGFIAAKDKNGELGEIIERHRSEYQSEHPEIVVTTSDILRLLVRAGSQAIDSRKPKKLSDKINRGTLRKS